MQPADLPPQFRAFAKEFRPLYKRVQNGGPLLMFNDGGWDMGWGVIVGKDDLVDPHPIDYPVGRPSGRNKRLRAGVYLYAF